MFQILDLDKSSTLIQTTKKSKITPAETVSKVPTNTDNVDFLDFVPIDNNSDDFDLNEIPKTIDTEEKQKDNSDTNQNAIALETPHELITQPMENATVPTGNPQNPGNYVQNINSTQMQNQPIIPRMIFPNSNITINYNFAK